MSPATAAIADPTQASADDLRLLVSVACDRGVLEEPTALVPSGGRTRSRVSAVMP